MADILNLPENEKFNTQTYTVSDIFDPSLEKKIPTTFKEWGVPIPYKVFLSPSYDLSPREYEQALLGGTELPDEEATVDLRVPGAISGVELYEELGEIFQGEFNELVTTGLVGPNQAVVKRDGEDKILIHPFKLALYLTRYVDEMDQNFEIVDSMNEFIDKLFLIGILPHVFFNLHTYLKLNPENRDVGQTSAADFIDEISKDIHSKADSFLTIPTFFEDDCYIEIAIDDFKKLLKKGGDFSNDPQLFIGISDLDELLSKQLTSKYEIQKNRSIARAPQGQSSDIELASSWPEERVVLKKFIRAINFQTKVIQSRNVKEIRAVPIDISSHHWLYKPARNISGSFIRGLSINTIEFDNDGFTPPPTVTEDIDLRPQVWAKTAFNLAAEKYIYEKRIEAGRKIIEDAQDLEAIYDIDEDYRADWNEYGNILARIDALRAEVSEFGYEIDINNAANHNKTRLGIFRTTTYSFQQSIIQHRIEIRHHKRRTGPFWRRKTRRWTTRHRVPYETFVTKQAKKATPISLDWDPIRTYLDQILDKTTYTIRDRYGKISADKTTAYQHKLVENIKLVKGNVGVTIETIKNGDKDFRIFSIVNNQLLDQFGNDLANVMQEAEDETVRSFLLLLLPVIEIDESGKPNVVSYKAIHNPVGSRNSYSVPTIVLHEEIEQTLSEDTNYFRGPLAHTETLLPGEKRYINIRTESKSSISSTESMTQTVEHNSKRSSSLQNQLRKEVTDMTRKIQQSSWSVSASGSGSFGFAKVGGSTSISGSRSKTTENTVKNLNDRVSKVMNETSQRNELTISTSTTENLEETLFQENKIEIENFNTGRSVTHRFHQLMRRFLSSSKIRDVKLLITYDDEFISGYGYRKAELIPLSEIDIILPHMVEVERSLFITKLKEKILMQYPEIQDQGGLSVPSEGIELPNEHWYVNSGSYVIATDIAEDEVLEDYVREMRQTQVDKLNAQASLYTSKAEAISKGRTVYPTHVDSFHFSSNEVDTGDE